MKLARQTIFVFLGLAGGLLADNTPVSRQAFHRSYTLSPHGRIRIENRYGDVCITGWDRNEVRIEAIKSASDEGRLADADIIVDASSERLVVRTQYAGAESEEPASVEYRITVPRTADLDEVRLTNGALSISGLTGGVKASSVNGNIKAERLAGRADLATVNGQVEAGFERLSASHPISLRSVNGKIVLSIPSGSGGQLIAQNRSGGIQTDLGSTAPRLTGHHLETVLGTGGPQILLHNVNGGISIHSTWSRRPARPDL
ncbi:MAG TPA: hypothetical protein VGF16_20005 [Bryobacteraceae bacterium]|jgi:DUF4097 and DUF4098 domain-containing protein YvlB